MMILNFIQGNSNLTRDNIRRQSHKNKNFTFDIKNSIFSITFFENKELKRDLLE